MKSKLFIVLVIAACLCLSACTERSADSSQSSENTPPSVINDSQKSETKEEQAEQDQKPQQSAENPSTEEPTEEELEELFTKAMHKINELATEDPCFIITDIFNNEIEIDYDDNMTMNYATYVRTSRQYSELEDYYGQIFSGEALDWLMSTKFADVDGTLYCSKAGGASGIGFRLLSIEKLQKNTYKGTYLTAYDPEEGEGRSTIFEVQKTDAGYRISSIDYCPDLLDHKLLNERRKEN